MTTPAPTPSPDGGFDDHAGAALAALVRRFASADGDGDDARPAFDAGMVARLRRLPAGGAASVDVWTALHGALPPERVDALVQIGRAHV